MTALATTVNLS